MSSSAGQKGLMATPQPKLHVYLLVDICKCKLSVVLVVGMKNATS